MSYLRIAIATVVMITAPVEADAAKAKISVGGESTDFEITHCRADTHQSGQLQVEAELTAVGSFRGRSATLLLAKTTNARFENIDLHLVELTADQRNDSTLAVSNQIAMAYTKELGEREREAEQMPSREELENLDPQEAMARMNAAMGQTKERRDAVKAEMDAKFAHTRSFGTIAVSGSTIEFTGEDTRVIRGKDVEAFADVAGTTVRVTADCAD